MSIAANYTVYTPEKMLKSQLEVSGRPRIFVATPDSQLRYPGLYQIGVVNYKPLKIREELFVISGNVRTFVETSKEGKVSYCDKHNYIIKSQEGGKVSCEEVPFDNMEGKIKEIFRSRASFVGSHSGH